MIATTTQPDLDAGLRQAEERHTVWLDEHKTRYVFTPFMPASCPQIPGGTVEAGVITPIQAPERHCFAYELGEDTSRVLRKTGDDPLDVVTYLDTPGPIANGLYQRFGLEGLTEIVGLAGMPAAQFEAGGINQKLFGGIPLTINRQMTADGYRTRLGAIIAGADSSPGGQMLAELARQILLAVEKCNQYCQQQMTQRHAQIKDITSDAPKRYSARDRRMLEFTGLQPLEEQMQSVVTNQTLAIERQAAAAEDMARQMAEREDSAARREERMLLLFDKMVGALDRLGNGSDNGTDGSHGPHGTDKANAPPNPAASRNRPAHKPALPAA